MARRSCDFNEEPVLGVQGSPLHLFVFNYILYIIFYPDSPDRNL